MGRAPRLKGLDHLAPADALRVLRVLVRRRPELVPELEEILRGLVADVDCLELADQVVAALGSLSVLDMAQWQDPDPFTYRDEAETVWAVYQQGLAPFVEPLRHYARMGLAEVALEQCQGVLLGLYRVEVEAVGELVGWLPDGLSDLADTVLEDFRPVRRQRLGSSGPTAASALKQFARENLPDWSWLPAEV